MFVAFADFTHESEQPLQVPPQPISEAEPISDADLLKMLSRIRRHLHQFPEIGFDVQETSHFVREWLTKRDFSVQGPLAETGLYVDVVGNLPGPTIAYRADMDALPIKDAKNVSYASKKPGYAHLCGHDAHTAIACGLAALLNERKASLRGTVRIFFQPNEESNPSGAPIMIQDGVLQNVEAAYAIHVDPTIDVGRFGVKNGALTAGCSSFVVEVKSSAAGHSARPFETVDTVFVANQILSQFYQLATRVTDSRKASVITACTFQGGGTHNVIPDVVTFGGTVRSEDPETLGFLRDKMRRVAGSMGALYGAEVDVDYGEELPPVMNTSKEVETVRESVSERYGPEALREIPVPSMGGEDFSFYLKEVPGMMLRLGSSSNPKTRYPLHHVRFDIDEMSLGFGARLMADVLVKDLEKRAG